MTNRKIYIVFDINICDRTMLPNSEEILLIKTMAGDMDTTLFNLFSKYQNSETPEKERLKKIIEHNLRTLEETVGIPVADFYKTCFSLLENKYPKPYQTTTQMTSL